MAVSQTALNGYIAAIGAAGGVAYFVTLLYPKAGRWVILGAGLVTLAIALGVVAGLEAEVNPNGQ